MGRSDPPHQKLNKLFLFCILKKKMEVYFQISFFTKTLDIYSQILPLLVFFLPARRLYTKILFIKQELLFQNQTSLIQSDIYVILIIFISISFNDRLSFFFSGAHCDRALHQMELRFTTIMIRQGLSAKPIRKPLTRISALNNCRYFPLCACQKTKQSERKREGGEAHPSFSSSVRERCA